MLVIFIVIVICVVIPMNYTDLKTNQTCHQGEPLIRNTTHDCYELRKHR